jgi:hypothetical protein
VQEGFDMDIDMNDRYDLGINYPADDPIPGLSDNEADTWQQRRLDG